MSVYLLKYTFVPFVFPFVPFVINSRSDGVGR